MAKVEDYFLDSLNKFKILDRFMRTKGSSQIIVSKQNSFEWEDLECNREYLIIEKDKKPVFVKRIISCPLKKLSIPEFIKLQAENLLELDDLDFVPRLEFYTLDSIGMTYFENSKTIKQIFMEGDSLPDYLVDDIISKARLLVNRLGQKKMNYDLSVNNILVRDGSVFFVDFDYSRRRASVSRLKFVLENLISGDMFFDSRGKLRTSSPLTKILFFLRGVYD